MGFFLTNHPESINYQDLLNTQSCCLTNYFHSLLDMEESIMFEKIQPANNFPKNHTSAWAGLVGKGGDGEEPIIPLLEMMDLTAAAEVDGVKYDGFDLFLFEPHISIDATNDDLKQLAEEATNRNLDIGSVVAPVWPPTGGGSAMGDDDEQGKFLTQVRKGCYIAKTLREIGVRKHGAVRIDSACSVKDWLQDPAKNTARIADTFSKACDIAEDHGERLAAEGEICHGGMHSWREMIKLLEAVDRRQTLGFQADMAHTLLYLLGYNAAEEDRVLPRHEQADAPAFFNWKDQAALDTAYKQMTSVLRPWTIDFHVAQNDATVKGSSTHDKTGRHCLPKDPNGKLDIVKRAGSWLRDGIGVVTKAFRHVCWDGCMVPNNTLRDPATWNSILEVMIKVRQAHGWYEEAT